MWSLEIDCSCGVAGVINAGHINAKCAFASELKGDDL